jgi:phosphoglycerol transferase MdoB-like AlkP superfamily enzyme
MSLSMFNSLKKVKVLLLFMLFWLVVYSLIRVFFLNIYFSDNVAGQSLFKVFYWGFRIDFTILFYINLPFFLYYIFLYDLLPSKLAVWIAWVLMFVNIPFLALNLIDLVYFGFVGRRSSVDLLYVLKDTMVAIPGFLVSYWYLFVCLIGIVILFIVVGRRLLRANVVARGRRSLIGSYLAGLLVLLIMAGVAYGETGRPIMPSTPLLYFSPEYQPLVNNSAATFLYSVVKRQQQLSVKSFFTPEQLDSVFTIRRHYPAAEPFQKKNVVIFIMESFCKEYLDASSPFRSRTPFIDSLIGHGTWFSNAYGNGDGSNKGLVAILGSLPTFMDEPYYYSAYSHTKFNGIGSILQQEGYSTHFFMGASPDHYGFGKFCKMTGIDHYYSEKDFGDKRFHDGQWGIYDHKFLPYAASVLKQQQTPFFATVFNLSTHSPFAVPDDLRARFEGPGLRPMQVSAAYFDYSLRLFFDSIRNEPWYQNTLFVFSADHSINVVFDSRNNGFTFYHIPIFIFDPSDTAHRVIDHPVQQFDIVPTILDKLHYSKPFMSFGYSVRDTTTRYVFNRFKGISQLTDNRFILGYNDEKDQPVFLYNVMSDPAMQVNLLQDSLYAADRIRMEHHMRGLIQRYNNALIKQQLLVE